MKLKEAVPFLTKRFALAGIETPQVDAEWLLTEICHLRRTELFLYRERELSVEESRRLEVCAGRREQREPLQYILGCAPFMDLELEVTPAVLIPRPETELLAERAIARLPFRGRMLDLGCGSGAIALAVATARRDAEVLGVDFSPAALEVAERNRRRLKAENLRLEYSDLWSNVSGRFDWIAANLPYVTEEEYLALEKEVRCFEPKLALTAPDSGFALLEKAALKLPDFLAPGGEVMFELAPAQTSRLAALLRRIGLKSVAVLKDYPGRERFVVGFAPDPA